jgi:hypothetical protein
MDYYSLSLRTRHRAPPYGYTSRRAYWIEMWIVCPSFVIGMICVALASLIEKAGP